MSTPARVMPLRSPLPKPAPRRTSPLRLVPPRRSSAAKTPFAAVLVVLLGGGLLGLLLLNTMVAQQSFSLHDLSAQEKKVTQQEQDLNQQVQDLEAPASLAARAAALHMVPSGAPAFLRLSDGKVLGKPQPGVAPVVPKASTTWTGPKQPTKTPPTATTRTSTTRTSTTRTSSTGAHR